MPENQVVLQELLTHAHSHAPWLALDEHQPHSLLKSNLKLLRGLSGSSKITLETLNELTEQEIKSALAFFKTNAKRSVDLIPKTPAQFFYAHMAQSLYLSDIIRYPGMSKSTANSHNDALSATESANPQSATQKKEDVHGFHLNDNEAFSSTRYYSDDKKNYAQIIAKKGHFEATHENLSKEQETDLALEMGFQFLLNLSPGCKTAYLNGTPEMVHRLHAAFLYLKTEAGDKYADLKIILPQGLSLAADENPDDYIKKHLGSFNKPPQQIVQWQQFLKMDSTAPTPIKEAPLSPTREAKKTSIPEEKHPPPKEEKPPIIDMARVFQAHDLSQTDKKELNEYQLYLKEVWCDGPKRGLQKTDELIAQHQEFIQRTEAAVYILKNAPSLKQEYEALKNLYIKTLESHQAILNELHQNDLDFEIKMKEMLPQIHLAQREAIEECVLLISEYLDMEVQNNITMSEELMGALKGHVQNMQDIKNFIEGNNELSNDMIRFWGAQMLYALNHLESHSNSSLPPYFQQMKEFSHKQAETKDTIAQTAPEQLMQASKQVKERLNQFKREFQEHPVFEITLDSEIKEELNAWSKKLIFFTEDIEEDLRLAVEDLADLLQKISDSSVVNAEQIHILHQNIERLLPKVQDNQEFVATLSEVKAKVYAPEITDELLREPNNIPIQVMR